MLINFIFVYLVIGIVIYDIAIIGDYLIFNGKNLFIYERIVLLKVLIINMLLWPLSLLLGKRKNKKVSKKNELE